MEQAYVTPSTRGSHSRAPCRPGLPAGEAPQLLTINLGSGHGQSVLEVVQAMEAATGRSIPYAISDRRPGDAAISVADPSKAAQRLGWRTHRGLADICRDGWAWQQQNPEGYI